MIKASKPHHTFSEFKEAVKITPKMSLLPDIVATQYEICGAVSILHPPTGVVVSDRTITVTSADGTQVCPSILVEFAEFFHVFFFS